LYRIFYFLFLLHLFQKPIIKSTHLSTSSNSSQLTPQNKTTILQSIKNFNPFTSKDTQQNTGFLTGPLSLNNYQINEESISGSYKTSSRETSSRSLFSKTNSVNGSKDDINKKEDNKKKESEEQIQNKVNQLFGGDVLMNEPFMEDEDSIALPQIVYLGDYCEPFYLIIYKVNFNK